MDDNKARIVQNNIENVLFENIQKYELNNNDAIIILNCAMNTFYKMALMEKSYQINSHEVALNKMVNNNELPKPQVYTQEREGTISVNKENE